MKIRTIAILIIILVAAFFVMTKYVRSPQIETPTATSSSGPIATAHYTCDGGKSIDAEFYQGAAVPSVAGQPPVPGGSVHVVLSDGREMTLKQTISADGVRYSNGDPSIKEGQPGAETFVFWSKGNSALVQENGSQAAYANCMATQ